MMKHRPSEKLVFSLFVACFPTFRKYHMRRNERVMSQDRERPPDTVTWLIWCVSVRKNSEQQEQLPRHLHLLCQAQLLGSSRSGQQHPKYFSKIFYLLGKWVSLSWLRSTIRPVLLPLDCLEHRVAEATEGHEQFGLSMMLARAVAGRALCACWAVAQSFAFISVSDCRRCSLHFKQLCSEQQGIHLAQVVVRMGMTLLPLVFWYY